MDVDVPVGSGRPGSQIEEKAGEVVNAAECWYLVDSVGLRSPLQFLSNTVHD